MDHSQQALAVSELFPNIINTLVYLVLSVTAWNLSHKMWTNPETENNQPCLTGMCIIISASASATVHHGTIEPVYNDNFGAFMPVYINIVFYFLRHHLAPPGTT